MDELSDEKLRQLRERYAAEMPRDDAQGWGGLNHVAYLGEVAQRFVPALIDEVLALRSSTPATGPESVALREAIDTLNEVHAAVFGIRAGDEPDIYKDHDELCKYAGRSRNALDVLRAALTAAGQATPTGLERCPTCNSPDPARHPAVQYEGEVEICRDAFHASTDAGRAALDGAGQAAPAAAGETQLLPMLRELLAYDDEYGFCVGEEDQAGDILEEMLGRARELVRALQAAAGATEQSR